MMTKTGKVAAAWLLAATQTDIYKILLKTPGSRSPAEQAEVAGLKELDDYFQTRKADLEGAAAVMATTKATFLRLLKEDADYGPSGCPGGAQLEALADQGA